MLIQSHRHKNNDLELWLEYAEADLLNAKLANGRLRGLIADALDCILEFIVFQPDCYCGVSWGKDSVVVAHLLWCVSRDVPLMHLRPTNHNPDCDAVRDAFFGSFPGQPYEEIEVDYSEIDRVSSTHEELDRLTDAKWYSAIHKYEQAFNGRHILGIRADESNGRLIRMLRWGNNSPNACAPIGFWKSNDVFAYLALHNLPVHPAYAMLGGGRWPRERLRVAEIGDTHGTGGGRSEWEREYYGDVLRRLEMQRTGVS